MGRRRGSKAAPLESWPPFSQEPARPLRALRHLGHGLVHSFFHLFRGQISLMGCDRPFVAEGITQLAVAITPNISSTGISTVAPAFTARSKTESTSPVYT